MLKLLRNRDLALLISGQAVSELGDGIFFVALAWHVYQYYSSPAALSVKVVVAVPDKRPVTVTK